MLEIQCQELEMHYEELYPNYEKTIKDFMADKNKELEFRKFIKKERAKKWKI